MPVQARREFSMREAGEVYTVNDTNGQCTERGRVILILESLKGTV